MISCVIIDDDITCINTLSLFIKNFAPQLQVVAQSQSIAEGAKLINQHQPKLVFLDVELNNEMGFDLFTHFPNPNFEVIFCTAHQKYAMQAIKLSAFDFILKPIDAEDFTQAIEKYIKKSNNQLTSQRVELLLDAVKTKEFKKIAIPSHDSITFIETSEIICCLGESKYTTIYTANGEKIVSSKNLGEFEAMLNPQLFFRSHKSWIINITTVKKFLKTDSQVLLSNGMLVDVSTRKRDEFFKLFEKL